MSKLPDYSYIVEYYGVKLNNNISSMLSVTVILFCMDTFYCLSDLKLRIDDHLFQTKK